MSLPLTPKAMDRYLLLKMYITRDFYYMANYKTPPKREVGKIKTAEQSTKIKKKNLCWKKHCLVFLCL